MHNTKHNRYAITYKNTHLYATDLKQLKSTETTPKTKKNIQNPREEMKNSQQE